MAKSKPPKDEQPTPDPVPPPVAPPAPKVETPEEKTLKKIRYTLAEIERLERVIANLGEKTKLAKAEMDDEWEELRKLNRSQTEEFPLIDHKPQPEVITTPPVPLAVAAEPDEPDEPDASAIFAIRREKFGTDLWQDVPVATLKKYGLPGTLVKKLAESNITTIEGIKKLGDNGIGLTDVKGIGETAENKIHLAMDAFWTEWGPETVAQAESEAEKAAETVVDASEAEDVESPTADAENASENQQDSESDPETESPAVEPAPVDGPRAFVEPEDESQETLVTEGEALPDDDDLDYDDDDDEEEDDD